MNNSAEQSTTDGQPVGVSGATGFIGSAVVRELLAQGRQVRALVEPGADTRNLDGLPVTRVTVDVRDYEGMVRALDGCRSYFHLAAIYEVWMRDRSPIYEVNIEGSATALLAAQKVGTQRVVYTSSIAAIGIRDDGAPSDESTPFNLYGVANDYILTKHLSERLALRFAAAGVPIVVVNPGFPFGKRDIGPTPTGRLILSILRGEVPAITPGGFCAIDVRDVAKAHVAAETKGRLGERYVLANHNVTFREFVRLVCRQAGMRAPWLPVPKLVGPAVALGMELWSDHVSHTAPTATFKSARYVERKLFLDGSKARTELGMPCTPLEETITNAVGYFRDHGMV